MSWLVQEGVLGDTQAVLACLQQVPAHDYVFITDERVDTLYAQSLVRRLGQHVTLHRWVMPVGESAKTLATVEALYQQLLQWQCGRDTCLVAVGGGVVLDMVGYVGATYMRGVPVVAVPTTLLAMVDVCVGGKTGVNVDGAKNMVGCFSEPAHVLVDPCCLETLSSTDYEQGLVECVKHALLSPQTSMHAFLMRPEQWRAYYQDPLRRVDRIREQMHFKQSVVEQDWRESGARAQLNLGHTLGHAIETASEYRIAHGQAVAVGLSFALWLSMTLLDLPEPIFRTVHRGCMKLSGVQAAWSALQQVAWSDLLAILRHDKKGRSGAMAWVLLQDLGKPWHTEHVWSYVIDEQALQAHFRAWIRAVHHLDVC